MCRLLLSILFVTFFLFQLSNEALAVITRSGPVNPNGSATPCAVDSCQSRTLYIQYWRDWDCPDNDPDCPVQESVASAPYPKWFSNAQCSNQTSNECHAAYCSPNATTECGPGAPTPCKCSAGGLCVYPEHTPSQYCVLDYSQSTKGQCVGAGTCGYACSSSTDYECQLKGFGNGVGMSQSECVSSKNIICPRPPTPPAVTNVSSSCGLTPSGYRATVSWSGSTGATSYEISFRKDSGGVGANVYATNSTTYTANVESSKTYEVIVYAVNPGASPTKSAGTYHWLSCGATLKSCNSQCSSDTECITGYCAPVGVGGGNQVPLCRNRNYPTQANCQAPTPTPGPGPVITPTPSVCNHTCPAGQTPYCCTTINPSIGCFSLSTAWCNQPSDNPEPDCASCGTTHGGASCGIEGCCAQPSQLVTHPGYSGAHYDYTYYVCASVPTATPTPTPTPTPKPFLQTTGGDVHSN